MVENLWILIRWGRSLFSKPSQAQARHQQPDRAHSSQDWVEGTEMDDRAGVNAHQQLQNPPIRWQPSNHHAVHQSAQYRQAQGQRYDHGQQAMIFPESTFHDSNFYASEQLLIGCPVQEQN